MQLIFNSMEELKTFCKYVGIGQEKIAVPMKEPVEEIPFTEDKAEENEVSPAEPEKTYTLVEVRAKLSELTKSGRRAQVKALLNSFGVEKLVDIKEADYPELMKKAGEL